MSYDIDMVMPENGYPLVEGDPISWLGLDINVTYNLRPMFVEAFNDEAGLKFINGKTGADARDRIFCAWNCMRSLPEVYKPMNPANGWGDYDIALKVMEKLLEAADKHPRAAFVVT